MAAEAGESSVEEIEDAGGEDEPDGGVDLGVGEGGCGERVASALLDEGAFNDFQCGGEATEKVACGHEVRQEVDLRAGLVGHFEVGWNGFECR